MRSGDLPAAVRAGWGLPVEDVRPTDGGMNSITWYLRSHGNSYVAKWVPRDEADALQVGCEAAMELAELGLRTGPPRPTLDGGLATEAGGGLLALLEKVPGAPLTGETDRERRAIGQLLGRVHAATRCARPGHSFPLWLRFDSSSLDLEPWLRPAVADALAAYDALPELDWARLHTDPAPEAFFAVPGAETGLVDWSGSVPGPVLYDVASAVMYLGGPEWAAPLLSAWEETSGLVAEPGALRVLLRLRGAVQAAYFAERLLRCDRRGLTTQEQNRAGLEDGRRMLATYGSV